MKTQNELTRAKERPKLGAAHARARDAYRDVPILKSPTWKNEVAAYFFFGGISAGAGLIGAIAETFWGGRGKRVGPTSHHGSFFALFPFPPLLIDDPGMASTGKP